MFWAFALVAIIGKIIKDRVSITNWGKNIFIAVECEGMDSFNFRLQFAILLLDLVIFGFDD